MNRGNTRDIVRQVVNVIAYIATVVVNTLANTLPLNNLSTGEISDRFDVLFVPAGYAFSIWGLIYLALAAFTIYQALPAQRDNPALRAIGYGFAISSVFNIGWLFAWHYEQFPLSLVMMLGLLITLIVIYLRLDPFRGRLPLLQRATILLPFSLYLGWITVATAANATSVLDYLNWGGWGLSPTLWTIILLIVVEAIAAGISFTRADVAYQLVLIWAVVAIAVKNWGHPVVPYAALIAALVLVAIVVVGLLLRRTRDPRRTLSVT